METRSIESADPLCEWPVSALAGPRASGTGEWSITPRLWISRFTPTNDEDFSFDSLLLLMAGTTLTWTPKSSTVTYMATALYGEGSGDTVILSSGADAATDVRRLDTEILARSRLSTGRAFWHAGLRIVTWNSETHGAGLAAETDTVVVVPELGIGTETIISEDGIHRLFSSFTLGAAFLDWEWSSNYAGSESGSSISPAIDINLGWSCNVTDSGQLTARYRAFILTEENDLGQLKDQSFHGPEFSFALKF